MNKTFATRLLLLVLAGLLALAPMALAEESEEEKVLNIFTWESYIDYDSIIAPFTEATGIKVNYANFSSNEEMLTKLQAVDGGEYDIILASDYILNIARKADLLQKLDKDKISNFANIDEQFLGQFFDPDSEYVVPYVAGTPLIIYDPARVDIEINGYADLWDPALADSLVLMDDARNVVAITLKTLGYSFNTTDPEALEEARAKLLELAPNIHILDYDSPHVQLISGEATVGYTFTPFVALTLMDRPDFEIVYPEEGMGFGIDGIVIPVNAPHPDNAHAFLQFLLDPEVFVYVPEYQLYRNVNKAAEPLLSEEYLANTALNIPEEYAGDFEYIEDVGEAESLFQDIWTEFKQNLN